MLSVSPRREAVVAEARKLFSAGESREAWDILVGDRFDHGIDPVVVAELRRLFPIPPEEVRRIAEFQEELDNPDSRERQKAARRIAGFVLGTVSDRICRFVQHAETMDFFLRNLDGPDPVVQENMTVCIARTLDKYVHDDRAYEPLTRMTAAARIVTRQWAIEGLAALTDEFVPWAIRLLGDRSAKVRTAAIDAMALAIGSGNPMRPPLGVVGCRQIADALINYDLGLDSKERISRATLLSHVAKPSHLAALKEWHKKDKSKQVREALTDGIKRIEGISPAGSVADR